MRGDRERGAGSTSGSWSGQVLVAKICGKSKRQACTMRTEFNAALLVRISDKYIPDMRYDRLHREKRHSKYLNHTFRYAQQ